MDFPLQVHGAKYIFPIPDGLKELTSDIIREVLRHQPTHINGFVADYLETMLTVRQYAREAGVVVCDTFEEGHFYDDLFRTRNVSRDQANFYATIIQAAWRGYVVRKKIGEWLKKKKKAEEQKEIKRSIKIEELLAGLGITYQEAIRAAGVIQTAYKQSKRGRWVNDGFGEVWVGETIPFGQRLREGDRAQGRFDRWEKEDFGDFFELTEEGAIKYVWPRIGQLQKVSRGKVPKNIPTVEFFAMRDLTGQEQYSYLIKSQPDTEIRGVPIGILIPLPKSCVVNCNQEIKFINPEYTDKMGSYTYIFRDDFDREELGDYHEILKAHEYVDGQEIKDEQFDYDPHWVLPRMLIKIKKEYLRRTDVEVTFEWYDTNATERDYTFRAETAEDSHKIIRHILRNKCLSIEEAMIEAGNMKPYKVQETGRIFPVPDFTEPSFIQKIEIKPETKTAKIESEDMDNYVYIFVPQYKRFKYPKQPLITIPIARFQGYHSDYKGSSELQGAVFILGPKVSTPNGKPFTYESIFWEEFGEESYYQLLNNPEAIVEIEAEEAGEGDLDEQIFEEEEDELIEKKTSVTEETTDAKTDITEKLTEDTEVDRPVSEAVDETVPPEAQEKEEAYETKIETKEEAAAEPAAEASVEAAAAEPAAAEPAAEASVEAAAEASVEAAGEAAAEAAGEAAEAAVEAEESAQEGAP